MYKSKKKKLLKNSKVLQMQLIYIKLYGRIDLWLGKGHKKGQSFCRKISKE